MRPIKPKPLPKRVAKWLKDVAHAPQGAQTLTIGRNTARAILAALEYANEEDAESHTPLAGDGVTSASITRRKRSKQMESLVRTLARVGRRS